MILDKIDTNLLIAMPGGGEWLTIALLVFVLFGAKKIPELARGLGKGIKEFNDAKEGDGKQEEKAPQLPNP